MKKRFNPLSYLYSRVIMTTNSDECTEKIMFQSPIVSLQSGHSFLLHRRLYWCLCFNPLSYLYSRVITEPGDSGSVLVGFNPLSYLYSRVINDTETGKNCARCFNPLSYLYSRVIAYIVGNI